MKTVKATPIIISSLLLLTLLVPSVFSLYIVGEDTIVRQTKEAVLIVAGKVSDVQYVQPNMNIFEVYTDVTLDVSEVLKGEPNIDDKTVRFRLEGGVGFHPLIGENCILDISTNMDFIVGDEMILFLIKRTWGDGWPFYDGLYPKMHPVPPHIEQVNVDGKDYRVAQFWLAFFEEKYTMNIPVETAFRFIRAAAKAPDETSLLEEKIRPIQARTMERLQDPPLIESPKFIGLLDEELTKIEAFSKHEK